VRAAISGDMEARERIVIGHQKMVYNLALRLMRNPDEAAVVLQETFLKVFAALPRFRAQSRLETWIYRIAVNEALQRLRRSKESRFVDIENLDADPSRDLSFVARALDEDPHVMVENRELRDRLEAAIGELSPKHRTAFVLVDIEGLPLKEAARDAGTTLASLKSDLRRARLFLRDRLAAYLEENRGTVKITRPDQQRAHRSDPRPDQEGHRGA
jgi:RNA polymerase sigma-70 factor, ECF subfamily